MKIRVLLLVFLTYCIGLNAQNPAYKNGLSFKKLFMDYQSQNGGSLDAFKDYHSGFEIGYLRKISNGLNVNIPFKFGNVQQYNNTTTRPDNCLHKRVAGLDAQLQYHFYNHDYKIVPYLMAGAGGVMEFSSTDFDVQIPLGVGVNFKAADNAYINIQSEYRYSFGENRNNLHHALGFVYLFPKSDVMEEKPAEEDKKEKEEMSNDKDKDGIEDKLDLCPDDAGLATLNGCPDTDKDGVPDFQDNCPGLAGSKDLKGCPDSDGDGLADNEDDCPNLTGIKSNKGCPQTVKDTDGDGVPDDKDKCPEFAGKPENNGCPVTVADRDGDGIEDRIDRCPDTKGLSGLNGCPDKDGDDIADPDDNCPSSPGLKVYNGCPDSDGDGLDDSRDKCPNTPGTVASGGCPDIAVEDKKTLDIAMRAVQFETGKSVLKSESYTILKQIASILSRYPDYNLAIQGHTDNTGSAVANQELSEKRAKACYEYLITQGIESSRMSHAGYGESRPVADNNTENGKALNRRVEFNLNPR